MTEPVPAPPLDPDADAASIGRGRGRTEPLAEEDARRLFEQGIGDFNGVRYWHAHEAWETLWRAADDDERDFYQGLIQVAAGLLHLQRRNARGARNKLREGIAKLRPYLPTHRGIIINELLGKLSRTLADLEAGYLPYLIPPVLRRVEVDAPDFSR
jgi:predicted metal-dependent hydrolase